MIERTCKCGNVVLCKAIQGCIPCEVCKPPQPCVVEGCLLPRRGREWCIGHYTRWSRHGDVTVVGTGGRRDGTPCEAEGCDRRTRDRAYCRKHHLVWEKHGDPLYKRPARPTTCRFTDCDRRINEHAGQGYCTLHYKRLQKYGDPRGIRVLCGFCGCGFYPVNSLRALCEDCRLFCDRHHGTSAAEIAQRDGTDCSLCQLPVDLTIPWPHPMSATVDHIIPWSLGGTHDPQNLALAHSRCNGSKGNRVATIPSPATAR